MVILLAVAFTLIGTALGVAVVLALLIPAPEAHVTRLREVGAIPANPGPVHPTSTGSRRHLVGRIERLVEWLGRTLTPPDPEAQSTWRKLLVQAGHRRANAVFIFRGCRVLLAGLLAAAALLIAPHLMAWNGVRGLAVVLVSVGAGLFVPHWWLLRHVKSRQEEITDALPNALDLMVVCVEAGLGLDATIQRVAQERQFTKQALSEELQIVHHDTRAGRPRSEALLALKDRVGLTELSSLVVVLVQAEKMGTSIGRALRVHADSLRTKRRQQAEEQAAKIPVKMVFPLVLLIFPATLLVLLGPSYITIFKALNAIAR